MTPIEVTLELSNRAFGIEPILRKISVTPGGGFSQVGPELSVPGVWTVRVDALVADSEKLIFETEVPIRR